MFLHLQCKKKTHTITYYVIVIFFAMAQKISVRHRRNLRNHMAEESYGGEL